MLGPLVLLLCLVALACQTDTETYREVLEGSPLAFCLRSYMSPEDAQRLISSESWQVVEKSGLPKGDRRPPFNYYSISTEFSDLGQPGTLTLVFFNARLERVMFYPASSDTYLQTILSAGASTPVGQGTVTGFTRTFGPRKDYQRHWYIAWEDTRLVEQSNRWIMRYS
jgi:hypothetical protein